MKLERYDSNRKGLRKLLGSEGARVVLVRHAAPIAVVAQALYEADPPHEGHVEVTVESEGGHPGSPRARARVVARHPAAIAIEADRRPLGASLDAGG